jgi:undecaprenyl-diphosphatase
MSDIHADTALERAELSLAEDLAELRDTPVADLLHPVSKLADQPPMLALAAAGMLLGVFVPDRRVESASARALLAVLLATGAKHLIKHAVNRSRPHRVLDQGEYRSGPGAAEEKYNQSFPSGHTADAVAFARAVSRVFPQAAVPTAVFALLAGLAQPIRAAHYPSDVAAGGTIGFLAELLVDRLFARFATRLAPG